MKKQIAMSFSANMLTKLTLSRHTCKQVLIYTLPLFLVVVFCKASKVHLLHQNYPKDLLFTTYSLPLAYLQALQIDLLLFFFVTLGAMFLLEHTQGVRYQLILLSLRGLTCIGFILSILDHANFVVSGSVGDWFLLKFLILNFIDFSVFFQSQHLQIALYLIVFAILASLGVGLFFVRRLFLSTPPSPPGPPLSRTQGWAIVCLGASLVVWSLAFRPHHHHLTHNGLIQFARGVVRDLMDKTKGPPSPKVLSSPPLFDTKEASLTKTPKTQRHNVVFVVLESTRAISTSVHNPSLPTTPFLKSLGQKGLVVDNMYAVVPHTSKALVSLYCGVYPYLIQPVKESEAGGLPAQCLPKLLQEQNYQTVSFQSSGLQFENWRTLMSNIGFNEIYGAESLKHEGFPKVNYFGYEDRAMLKPIDRWLRKTKAQKKPFFMGLLTLVSHHDYQLPKGYKSRDFPQAKQSILNRYYNSIRYTDSFIKELVALFKKRGLLQNTIFVFVGDHGEGFGEHNRSQHNTVIWEEGTRVPGIIYAPSLLTKRRVRGLRQQVDFLPTILELLGLRLVGGKLPGASLLSPPQPKRKIFMSCWYRERCMAMRHKDTKYIFHYDWAPVEIYNLQRDPLEQRNLYPNKVLSQQQLDALRYEFLRWKQRVNLRYQIKHIAQTNPVRKQQIP